MTDELVPYENRDITPQDKKEVAFNGRKAKSSDAEIILALAPIYVAWPEYRRDREFVNLLCLYLRDIPSNKLAAVVSRVVQTSKFEPTIAHFREAYEGERREPGPSTHVDPRALPDIPQKMYRLSEEEDRQQRLEQLRKYDRKSIRRNWI